MLSLPSHLNAAYTITGVLGNGAYGVVYSATDATGAPVAIKVAKRSSEPQAYLRVGEHANIVRLITFSHLGARSYLVLERADSDLFNAIQGELKALSGVARFTAALRLFSDVIAGVVHMHANGVSHGDLKPENVLIRLGVAMIADLGAAYLHALMPDGLGVLAEDIEETFGTIGYAAPELLVGIPHNGFLADMWSLGIILFVLVSGFVPFYAASRRLDDRIAADLGDRPLFGRAVSDAAQRDDRSLVRAVYAMQGKECDMPDGTVELIDSLLSLDPLVRPTAAQVQAILMPSTPPPSAPTSPRAPGAPQRPERVALPTN